MTITFFILINFPLTSNNNAIAASAVVCNLKNYTPSILNMTIAEGKGRAWFNDKSDNNPLTSSYSNGFANIRIRWDNGDAYVSINVKTGEASYLFVRHDGKEFFTTAFCPVR